MDNLIEVEKLVNNINNYIIIDLRSPIEYEAGCIKNAINIPLLDNDKREMIGTLYKENPEAAYREGLKEGTGRLLEIYDEVKLLIENNPDKEVVFYCFRGGTRSKSVHKMLEVMKIKSYKLNGGYKKYRTYILENLDIFLNQINWLVVTGNTGSGKTIVLNKIKDMGYPIIDLEGLANHRGSIFGEIDLNNKITQKTFENNLFYDIKKYVLNNQLTIFIESESRRIGKLNLPNSLFEKLIISPHILLNVSIDKRIEIINEIYNPQTVNKEYIIDLINNNDYFKLKLGNKWVLEMIEALNNNDYKTFIKKMLIDYYDDLYSKYHKNYNYVLKVENDDIDNIVDQLINYYNEIKKSNI